jgi:hypothetical protein
MAPPPLAPPPLAPPAPTAVASTGAVAPANSVTPGDALIPAASLPLTSDFEEAGQAFGFAGMNVIGEYSSAAGSVGRAAGASLDLGPAFYEKALAEFTRKIDAAYDKFKEARQKCPKTPGVVGYEQAIDKFVEYARATKAKVDQPILEILKDQTLDRAQKVVRIQAVFAPIVAEDDAAKSQSTAPWRALNAEYDDLFQRKARAGLKK